MVLSDDLLSNLEEYEEDKSIWENCYIDGYENFHKDNENSKVWWTNRIGVIGELNISFDKRKIYNLYADYPYNMTDEEVEIFDKEEPYWANFFEWRKHR